MVTKITGLSGTNTNALEMAITEGGLSPEVILTKTTATFPWRACESSARLRDAMDTLATKHGRRGHPVQSLHAVTRRLLAFD